MTNGDARLGKENIMLDKARLSALPSYIDTLRKTKLPIFIYGMGDGCLKLLSILNRYSIPCSGIFASDEFVRDKVFEGHRIHKLSEIEESVSEFIVLLAFGAGYPQLMDKIDGIARRHRLIIPDMPVVGDGLFTKEYMLEHFGELDKVYSLLTDDISRRTYLDIIEYKITCELSALKSSQTEPEELYSILNLGKEEIYADLGAYTGDTIAQFLASTGGSYKKIIAMEPNPRNFRKLSQSVERLENVELINAAAGAADGSITMLKGGGRMIRQVSGGKGVEIPRLKLDSVLGSEDCTYIKYDVEGAEAEAIKGSEKTILRCKPKLNVSIYHRVEDLFALPLYINSLLPEKKIYIRRAPCYPAWEISAIVV